MCIIKKRERQTELSMVGYACSPSYLEVGTFAWAQELKEQLAKRLGPLSPLKKKKKKKGIENSW